MICPACGANWEPRKPNPVKCPRCWTHLNTPTVTVTQAPVVRKTKRNHHDPGVAGAATSCPSCGGLNGMHQKGCKR